LWLSVQVRPCGSAPASARAGRRPVVLTVKEKPNRRWRGGGRDVIAGRGDGQHERLGVVPPVLAAVNVTG